MSAQDGAMDKTVQALRLLFPDGIPPEKYEALPMLFRQADAPLEPAPRKKLLVPEPTPEPRKKLVPEPEAVTYISPDEAAGILKVTSRAVRRMLASGRLRGVRVGYQWRVESPLRVRKPRQVVRGGKPRRARGGKRATAGRRPTKSLVPGTVTVHQAAELLGVSPSAVHGYFRRGRLTRFKDFPEGTPSDAKTHVLISEAAVQDLKAQFHESNA